MTNIDESLIDEDSGLDNGEIEPAMESGEKKQRIAELNKTIDDFVDKFKHFPKQKSPEWMKMRTDGMDGVFIGGSDIASAINANDYQSPGQLIRSKCGLKTARDTNDPIAMHWGSLFEDVIARFVELDFKTTIKGTEMIICGHRLFRYSPDGFIVACVKLGEHGIEICDLDDPEGIPVIILCEFKTLWARLSKGKIPEYYVSQPLAGLEVAHIAFMAMFVEGLFKACSLDELGPSKSYSRLIHTRQRFINKFPIAWGMFFVYCDDEKEFDEFCKLKSSDVGTFDLDTFKSVMKKIDAGTYTTEFTDPKPYSPEAIEELISTAECAHGDKYFLGVLPWKMFEIHYFPMHRDSEYISGISQTLETVNTVIKKIKVETKGMTELDKEVYVTRELQNVNLGDDERGTSSPVNHDGRTSSERDFLNSL